MSNIKLRTAILDTAQNQQRPAQQQQPAQQYNGPPADYQPADRPPASPRQQYQQQPPQQQQQGGKTFTIPAGRAKGTLLAGAEEQDILYWIDKKANENNPRFERSNQEWVAAANAEIARRRGNTGNTGSGNGYAPPANTQGPPARQDRPPPPNNGYQQQRGSYAQPPAQHQHQGPPGPPPQDDWHPPGGANGDDFPF
jgi:hypothetical protein